MNVLDTLEKPEPNVELSEPLASLSAEPKIPIAPLLIELKAPRVTVRESALVVLLAVLAVTTPLPAPTSVPVTSITAHIAPTIDCEPKLKVTPPEDGESPDALKANRANVVPASELFMSDQVSPLPVTVGAVGVPEDFLHHI